MKRLIRVDKNGTKYWEESDCPRCGGRGYIPGYEMIEGGVCFKCNGSGSYPHKYIERTPEYAAKLAERRLAKRIKEAPERNAKFFASIGFSAEGLAWIAVGNTYPIKDQLKAAGARYHEYFGWHFDHKPEGFETAELNISEVSDVLPDGTVVLFDDPHVDRYMKEFRQKHYPQSESASEYVGEVGERITVSVKCIRQHEYERSFGYRTSYVTIFIFEDEAGNVFKWNCTNLTKIEDGEEIALTGTIKAHDTDKGTKQTVLTRCKVCA